MIKVQIVDDHRLLIEGLKKIIEESEVARVINIAYTGKNCLDQLKFEQPDVLLLDINLPDYDGPELCVEIKQLYPALPILALTTHREYAMVRRMLESGANGYVVKNAMCEEIMLGIETVARGEQFLCDEVDLLIRRRADNNVWLTKRENELLKLIVEGYTNPEIAEKIFLSPETIKGYRKNLLLKLGVKNTVALVKMALEQKLI